tara:strand:- start:193 stop:339 length:147 start_codon:yes stop_codon:yes gene_type:complete
MNKQQQQIDIYTCYGYRIKWQRNNGTVVMFNSMNHCVMINKYGVVKKD